MSESLQQALAYNRATAAAASGIPTHTLDLAIKAGEIPVIKSGRRLIILRDDLVAWLGLCKQRGSIPVPTTDADRERLADLNRARKAKAAA